MKILVVAPQPFFTPRGTPFSVYYRTLVTARLGHNIDLLTYGAGRDVSIPGCRIVQTPRFSWLGPVPIGPSFVKLFLDIVLVAWTLGILLRHRYEVVHAHEEAVFWCRWLRPLFRFRLVYDMHSSLVQQLDNFEFTRNRLVHLIFRKLERNSVRAADAVIVICPELREYAKSLGTDPDRIHLIENSIFEKVNFSDEDDPIHSDPRPSQEHAALEEWLSHRSMRHLVTYAGTLETYQGIDKLIEAFALVATRLPDAGLLIAGGSPSQVEHFRAFATSLGLLDQVFFAGQIDQARAQRLVALGAVTVSPRFAGNNTPLKIYQLAASGVPIVATRIRSHTQVLSDDLATLTEPDVASLADGMIDALEDPAAARTKAERAMAWYEKEYSPAVYTAKMQALLARIA